MISIVRTTNVAESPNDYISHNSSKPFTRRKSDLSKELNKLRRNLLLTKMDFDEQTVQFNQLKNDCQKGSKKLALMEAEIIKAKNKYKKNHKVFAELKSTAKHAIEMSKQYKAQSKKLEEEAKNKILQVKTLTYVQSQLVRLYCQDIATRKKIKKSEPWNNMNTKQVPKANSIVSCDNIQFNQARWLQSIIFGKLKTITFKSSKQNRLSKWNKTLVSTLNKLPFKKKSSNSLPSLKWVKSANCLPIRNGMYYVSDGNHVEISFFNKSTGKFANISDSMPVDYWCITPTFKKLLPKDLQPKN